MGKIEINSNVFDAWKGWIDMSNAGYVYVLINPSIEGLIKVGMTTLEPEERARQLSGATGVPTNFVVAYKRYVNDCMRAEKFVHTYLESKGYRINPKREFFSAPITEAINAIIAYNDEDDASCDEDILVDYSVYGGELELGQAYHYGLENTMIDYDKAITHYKRAISLGAPYQAYKGLGNLYFYEKNDYQKALEYYQKSVDTCLDDESYIDMGAIYLNKAGRNNDLTAVENFEKCIFNLTLGPNHFKEMLENEGIRNYMIVLMRRYIVECGFWTSLSRYSIKQVDFLEDEIIMQHKTNSEKVIEEESLKEGIESAMALKNLLDKQYEYLVYVFDDLTDVYGRIPSMQECGIL